MRKGKSWIKVLETIRHCFRGRVPNPTELGFLTCPRNREWIIGGILVPGTRVRLLAHGVHIKKGSGITALKMCVVF